MKYLALVYSNPGAFEAMSQAERDELMSEAGVYLKEFTDSGELIGEGFALADPSTGRTVRVRDGLPAVTDGPFAEAKELIAGYSIIEVKSKEEAIEWVRRWPPLDGHGHAQIEIRELFSASDFGAEAEAQFRDLATKK